MKKKLHKIALTFKISPLITTKSKSHKYSLKQQSLFRNRPTTHNNVQNILTSVCVSFALFRLKSLRCNDVVRWFSAHGRNASERRDVGGTERRVRARLRWGRPVATGPRSHHAALRPPCHRLGYNRTWHRAAFKLQESFTFLSHNVRKVIEKHLSYVLY